MVLRPLKAVKGNGRIEEEFTLGHDSIALVLDRWDTLDAAARQRREDKWNLIIGILFLISLVATIVYVPLAFLFDLTFRYLIYIWMPTVVFIYINLGYSFFRRVLERGLSFTFRPDLSPRKRRRA
jgi:small-conductance mechanosensitive channel